MPTTGSRTVTSCLRSHGIRFVCGVVILVAIAGASDVWYQRITCAEDQTKPTNGFQSPVTAKQSLKHFQLHPDLRIELVAAEPNVIDPVAIRFDEDGGLWVVEMSDYPNGPAKGESPKSRIRFLQDQNADGYYETSRVFADQLLFATGLQPWRGGMIVTMAGEVAYFRDTTGDGKADFRETWFNGFTQDNPQLRANHPTFALDNHIYVANGLRGGAVIAKKKEWAKDAKPVSISGMDFRFNPIDGSYEAVSGNGQFGMTFDDFGNRFICSNRNPCKHVVLEDRYIKRNPFLAVRSVFADVSPAGDDSRVYPISRTWTTSTLHEGQFTAACGVTIYRGDMLPVEFQGNSFTCEPTGNLVHRDVHKPEGATFSSKSGRAKVEFLATPDEWFRPVNLANGPDGALYVVDMYRAVIEHPRWVPDELKNRADNYYGNDRGRIYRIVPKGHQATDRARTTPALSKSPTVELVKVMEHANAWHRETAARLIVERQDKTIVAPLERIAKNGKLAQSRIHALWTLNGIGKLATSVVAAALRDPDPRVREQALRLAERRLDSVPLLAKCVIELASDVDPRLRFQVALTLGTVDDRAAILGALANIAIRGASDPWTRAAVGSSVGDQPATLLKEILRSLDATKRWDASGVDQLVAGLAEIIGSRQKPDEIHSALTQFSHPAANDAAAHTRTVIRIAGLDGLGQGSRRRGKALALFIPALVAAERRQIGEMFARASRIAERKQANVDERKQAISALRHASHTIAVPVLMKLAIAESNGGVRLAAIAALGNFPDPRIGPALLDGFSSQTPSVQRAILDAVLANSNRTKLLLDRIEAGQIAVSEIDAARVTRLSRHRNNEIQAMAKKLLAAAIPADRKQVLQQYQAALSLPSDPKRGREVFRKNCMTCHRIGGLGVNVAPDIADSRTKKPVQLLTSILDPNRAIDSNYFSYNVVTTQGKLLTGIIASETASSITLRQPENKMLTVLRQDIDEMRSNSVSLMPVGLEKNISVQQLADLISFIKNWRYLDGRVPIQLQR